MKHGDKFVIDDDGIIMFCYRAIVVIYKYINDDDKYEELDQRRIITTYTDKSLSNIDGDSYWDWWKMTKLILGRANSNVAMPVASKVEPAEEFLASFMKLHRKYASDGQMDQLLKLINYKVNEETYTSKKIYGNSRTSTWMEHCVAAEYSQIAKLIHNHSYDKASTVYGIDTWNFINNPHPNHTGCCLDCILYKEILKVDCILYKKILKTPSECAGIEAIVALIDKCVFVFGKHSIHAISAHMRLGEWYLMQECDRNKVLLACKETLVLFIARINRHPDVQIYNKNSERCSERILWTAWKNKLVKMIDEIVTEACENQVNSETLDAFEAAVDIFNYIQQQDVFLGYDTAAELDKYVSGWLQVLNNNAELHHYRHHVSEAVCVYNGFLKLNKTLIFQCQCKKTIQKIREHFPDTGPTPSASSDDLVESIIGEMMEQSETGNSFRSRLFECGNCIRRSKCPRNQLLSKSLVEYEKAIKFVQRNYSALLCVEGPESCRTKQAESILKKMKNVLINSFKVNKLGSDDEATVALQALHEYRTNYEGKLVPNRCSDIELKNGEYTYYPFGKGGTRVTMSREYLQSVLYSSSDSDFSSGDEGDNIASSKPASSSGLPKHSVRLAATNQPASNQSSTQPPSGSLDLPTDRLQSPSPMFDVEGVYGLAKMKQYMIDNPIEFQRNVEAAVGMEAGRRLMESMEAKFEALHISPEVLTDCIANAKQDMIDNPTEFELRVTAVLGREKGRDYMDQLSRVAVESPVEVTSGKKETDEKAAKQTGNTNKMDGKSNKTGFKKGFLI